MNHSPKPSILRFGDLTPRPWPNGRGITRDVTSRRASDGSHDWLISIAELVEDAAFSHYAGCNRIFTLVGENPVDLRIDGLAPLRCNPLVPVHFPGDRPTHCRLAGGRSRAFNLIFKRDRMMGAVSSINMAGNHTVTLPQRSVAVHCVAGRVTVDDMLLNAGDTLVAPRGPLFRTADVPAALLVVCLEDSTAGS